ncbi:MAG: cell shape-determining protein [Lachnospiraceae bacterium]|nr:cell shape-determining protein [Lachnospiraceae bacterium]
MNPWSNLLRQWLEKQPFYQQFRNAQKKRGKTVKTKKQTKPMIQWVKWLVIVYLVLILLSFFQGTLVLDLSLNAFMLLLVLFAVSFIIGIARQFKPALLVSVGAVICYLALLAYSSPLFRYQAHRDLIGGIEEVSFSDQIDYIDMDQVPIIDETLADQLADKKLGEIPSLGSQVTVGKMSLQNVDGSLYYVAPLEHTSFLKWLFNRTTSGYVKVSATNMDDVTLVTELSGESMNLKYLSSSRFLNNIQVAAFLRDMKKGHTDYTFEIDDSGRPYWVITRYDTGVGISEESAVGVEVVDAQTGETNVYGKEDLPEWIDRVEPMENIERYVRKWGELVHGVLNFTDKDKLTTTYGMNIIYNNDECYYYTGITSVGNDESLVGFTLTNTRTRETTLYRTSGATEEAAMASAQGKVQQYGYQATFPYLLNIDSHPTYFMTLKDDSGLVKQYAMVNVSSYSTVGVGTSLSDALSEYRKALSKSGASLSKDETATEETVTGTVARIGLIIQDEGTYYDIVLSGDDRIYTVSTETERLVALTAVGDQVSIQFHADTEEKEVTATGFQNQSLNE